MWATLLFSFVLLGNRKTKIPTTKTSRRSCPKVCPFIRICYAEGGPSGWAWDKVDKAGMVLKDFLAVLSRFILPDMVWRHNEAGDLPKRKGSEKINRSVTRKILSFGRPFTYTHHRVEGEDETAEWNRETIRSINLETRASINLSANNLAHADTLSDLDVGPVVVVLENGVGKTTTPAGRQVYVCPASMQKLGKFSCADCGGAGWEATPICARKDRDYIVGFPVHGTYRAKVERVVKGAAV